MDDENEERKCKHSNHPSLNCDENDNTVNTDDVTLKKKELWFDKLGHLVDHFCGISESFIFTLGDQMSIDEMLIRFMGRSNETHRIKNKPIGEGYKFFVLATTSGYIVNFTLDGCQAAKHDQLEYNTTNNSIGKFESMLLYLVEAITRLKKKENDRNERYHKRDSRSTRNNLQLSLVDKNEDIHMPKYNYIIAMDNYFSLPKAISRLRELGIGMVGTSRFKSN